MAGCDHKGIITKKKFVIDRAGALVIDRARALGNAGRVVFFRCNYIIDL